MFNNLVESSGVRRGARDLRFFVGTAVVWSVALVIAIAVGIMAFDARVSADFEAGAMLASVVPPPAPPPPPPPPGPARQTATATQHAPQPMQSHAVPPTGIAPPRAPSPPAATSSYGLPGGVPNGDVHGEVGGVPGSLDGNTPTAWSGTGAIQPPAPPPVPVQTEEPPARPQIVRSTILAGKALKRVQPAYPEMARRTGIEGAVVVEVLLDERGHVLSARGVSGHPLLRDNAIRAAKEWTFSPTLLNGVAVKVVGTITFNFKKV
jgi:protein TonB